MTEHELAILKAVAAAGYRKYKASAQVQAELKLGPIDFGIALSSLVSRSLVRYDSDDDLFVRQEGWSQLQAIRDKKEESSE
ncbi:MAG: hypothetical protein OXG04_01805 [Acidobacteria bacterium]|nr:hypothetical protein [Acidobacteriota bacterium]